jgi:TRAP-type C4-dicarboxylate transport system permease small subunit
MLASVKTWALSHLLVSGDLGSMILFGSFLFWGGYARIALKRRGDIGTTKAPAGWTNDILVIVIGVAVFVLLGLYFHPYVIGVPVFGH